MIGAGVLLVAVAAARVDKDAAYAARDRAVGAEIEAFERRASIAFDVASCVSAPAVDTPTWVPFPSDTPRARLPREHEAPAACFALPPGATGVHLRAEALAVDGEALVSARPSLMLLDENLDVISDIDSPRLHWVRKGKATGIAGHVSFSDDRNHYVVVYLDPRFYGSEFTATGQTLSFTWTGIGGFVASGTPTHDAVRIAPSGRIELEIESAANAGR